MNRLFDKYKQEVVPALTKEFGYTNPHQVPKIERVVLNVGAGRSLADARQMEAVIATLRKVSGQQPVQTVAKHSIAGFKLREGNKIGAKVTLRGEKMYNFVDRLVSVVLPRIRDFRGVSRSAFDPQGNYSIGLSEQSVFPEISYDEITITHGLQVNIVTSAKTQAEGERLLELMGFPFTRSN